MLTPEDAAVSLYLRTSFLLLIGKTTLVYMALCFQMKGSYAGGPGIWTFDQVCSVCGGEGGGGGGERSVLALMFP